jgi:uncharacterized membrane protein (UPF0127 family)
MAPFSTPSRALGGALQAVNATRDAVLAFRVHWAGTSAERRRGLLGRASFPSGEGLYLVPCGWIHTFGMAFPIDVAFLAAGGRVLRTRAHLPPFRIDAPVWGAEGVLELPAGVLAATGTRAGDVVRFVAGGGDAVPGGG